MTIPPFASGPPNATSAGFPTNDRMWYADMKASQQREQRAENDLHHYEVLGAGLAVFCISFWEAIRDAEPENFTRFTHDEALRLLEAAVRGR